MRLEKIDILRGIAIILMAIFHLNYSLLHIYNNNILNFSKIFWFYEGRISALLFIFVWWLSFYLSEKKYKDAIIKKYLKFSFFLMLIAWWISILTYFLFPNQYIRFWIIHFFSLSFPLLLLFKRLRYLNIAFWIIFIIYGFYMIPVIENQYFYFLGFTYPWFVSADFYPIFPYFGVLLLGYSSGLLLDMSQKLNILKLQTKKNILTRFFIYLWRRSLIIYLIHQPIIIFVLFFL